jgi:hypothetical protein
LHDIDWKARQCDTGFWVRKSAQGHGFATESTNAGSIAPLTTDSRMSTITSIVGRTPSMIKKQAQQRANLLQGTLDMLVLRTLLCGQAQGHQIGKHMQRTTNDFLQMQDGFL